MPGLKAAIAALKPLGERLMRTAGIKTADSMMKGVQKSFPGIFEMSREEFVNTLKSGKFATKFADDMGGQIAKDELRNITKYLAQGGKVEGGKLMQGMQEVHIAKRATQYETKAFGYVREGKVQVGGYMYRKGPKDDWVRAALYSSPKAPKAVDKYSIAKVISAKMAYAGGVAPKSLSIPGAKSYFDTVMSVRAAMQMTTDIVRADTSRSTLGGLARHVRRGGSSQGPQGGT